LPRPLVVRFGDLPLIFFRRARTNARLPPLARNLNLALCILPAIILPGALYKEALELHGHRERRSNLQQQQQQVLHIASISTLKSSEGRSPEVRGRERSCEEGSNRHGSRWCEIGCSCCRRSCWLGQDGGAMDSRLQLPALLVVRADPG
jgi:hypothetical protein